MRDVGAQRRNPSSKISGPNYGPNSRELVLKVYKNTETIPLWHCLCYEHRGEVDNRLAVKSYHLIEPPYCVYKIKQNLHNVAKYKILA